MPPAEDRTSQKITDANPYGATSRYTGRARIGFLGVLASLYTFVLMTLVSWLVTAFLLHEGLRLFQGSQVMLGAAISILVGLLGGTSVALGVWWLQTKSMAGAAAVVALVTGLAVAFLLGVAWLAFLERRGFEILPSETAVVAPFHVLVCALATIGATVGLAAAASEAVQRRRFLSVLVATSSFGCASFLVCFAVVLLA